MATISTMMANARPSSSDSGLQQIEVLSHRSNNVRVLNAAIGFEHDRSAETRSNSAEVLGEDGEPVGGL